MATDYQPPKWAGNPKPGLHLDVVKNETVLQKLLIDEKKCYTFGRNSDSCEFPLQHQSCSRVHAALVHHKDLNRPFLIDLGSAHGTFVGSIRLEANKPQQLFVDAMFRFGASSRSYVLREKPQSVALVSDEVGGDNEIGMLLGLADLDHEVDDLTQYNTAHNRQINTIGILDETISRKRHRRNNSVTFTDTEEVINPEDIDPNIGRFRNMIQTAIIPVKRPRVSSINDTVTTPTKPHPFTQPLSSPSALSASHQLYPDSELTSPTGRGQLSLSSSFHIHKITSAPPVENPAVEGASITGDHPSFPAWTVSQEMMETNEPKKKKYAKEAWPGKKPSHLLV